VLYDDGVQDEEWRKDIIGDEDAAKLGGRTPLHVLVSREDGNSDVRERSHLSNYLVSFHSISSGQWRRNPGFRRFNERAPGAPRPGPTNFTLEYATSEKLMKN